MRLPYSQQAERDKTVAANEYGAPISMGRGEIPMRATKPADTLQILDIGICRTVI